MSTPLTDAINALTTYANETTGASDTTLSAAVGTLAAGYGQGGGLPELQTFTVTASSSCQIDIDSSWFDNYDCVVILPDITLSSSDWIYLACDATSSSSFTNGSIATMVQPFYATYVCKRNNGKYVVTWFRGFGSAAVDAVLMFDVSSYLYYYTYVASKTMTGTFKVYGIKY